MIKTITELVDSFKKNYEDALKLASMNMCGIPVITEMDINYRTVQVVYDPLRVGIEGYVIKLTYNEFFGIVIFVDDNFMILSENARKSIIYRKVKEIISHHNITYWLSLNESFINSFTAYANEPRVAMYAISMANKTNATDELIELGERLNSISGKKMHNLIPMSNVC